jgi:hypothetical protein
VRSRLLPALLGALLLVPSIVQAGVLENMDLEDYRYETSGSGGIPLTGGTIYCQSVQSGVCVDGCQLKLLGTGQTITMQPDD